ncbi:MaoC/PaaZ C-terminal domain-containing protein [Actinomycetospora straminea]|uniref:MaoC family dehydratase n=1 Tax=Actinomycetospora straminea TaxID=663607 RepID=A0ABP9F8G8_9PSEU|nr:MaoC/PaaZ C-terminal domain-containing protein [Actinomycetospora straminea]MDD7935584.1 MaoC/PaaZ C-terminal domain-containing protein [Actinomycetospora straminea]
MTAPEVCFEDLPAGRRIALGSVVVDRDEMLAFNRRFDPQPFHVDEDAARASLFGGLCASGWFTASLWMRCYVDGLLSRAAALGSPGGDEISWPAPVFPGDRLDASLEILAARVSASRPQLGLVTLLGTLTREDGTQVYRGRFTGMFGRRDGAPAAAPGGPASP